jgi:hypothetical protein
MMTSIGIVAALICGRQEHAASPKPHVKLRSTTPDSLAMLAAIRRASSRVSSLAADRRSG